MQSHLKVFIAKLTPLAGYKSPEHVTRSGNVEVCDMQSN